MRVFRWFLVCLEAPLWFTWSMRDAQGIPRPSKTRILAASFGDVTVTRTDAFTLRLQPQDGFFPSDSSKMFRSPALSAGRRGEAVQHGGDCRGGHD